MIKTVCPADRALGSRFWAGCQHGHDDTLAKRETGEIPLVVAGRQSKVFKEFVSIEQGCYPQGCRQLVVQQVSRALHPGKPPSGIGISHKLNATCF
jgi:hypothetical protein